MSYILGFDSTQNHNISVAVLDHNTVVCAQNVTTERGQHSEILQSFIEDILKSHRISWSDLSALGVGIGPGNFTASRIGIAFARGLSLALGIPAIGISNFQALAWNAPRPLLAIINAPKKSLYAQLFYSKTTDDPMKQNFSQNAPILDEKPAHMYFEELLTFVDSLDKNRQPSYLVTNMAMLSQKIAPCLKIALHSSSPYLALNIAYCAQNMLKNDASCAFKRPAPLYVRPSTHTPHPPRKDTATKHFFAF